MSIFSNHGILGINARNLLYIRPYNTRKAVRFADDKLKTKQFLSARDIPVPRLYQVIRTKEELEKFDFSTLPSSFVLKPNMGFGGEGIIPFIDRKDGGFEKSSGVVMHEEELSEHIDDILEGRFSISGVTDVAFFEQRVICEDSLAEFAYKGLPDIRIVVHNLIPVMAMLRLPTKESDGKANLHQGAIGVGIDIAKGTATHLVYKNKIIDEVPNVGAIRGLKIPYWDEILLAASRVQLVTNLGYLAVDIVIDRNVGPVLLEINARAGLAVQIANLAPLRKRLERIEGVKVTSPEKGVRIAQDMFGNKIEKEVKKISGKEVIGSMEKVSVLGMGETHQVWASINPLLEESLVSEKLVKRLDVLEQVEGSEFVRMKLSLAEKRFQTLARPQDLSDLPYEMVLGRRDLQHFLIDPSKSKEVTKMKLPKVSVETPQQLAKVNWKEVDQKIVVIDKQIKLLHHLKPINLEEEKEAFLKDNSKNPQFEYPELSFDSYLLREELQTLRREIDDSERGALFTEKIKEIEMKIDLLESIGSKRFYGCSQKLFGFAEEDLIKKAEQRLSQMPKHFPNEKKSITNEEASEKIMKLFKKYGLDKWKVKIKDSMVSDCLAGKKNSLFLRKGASFGKNHFLMLIAHELETHILTAENGKQQDYELFSRGFAHYLETQEGLAIWNQEQVHLKPHPKHYRSAFLVTLIDFAATHSFVECFDFCKENGNDEARSFQLALRVKRGIEDTSKKGAFTKDLVYFRGYHQVKDFVENGGDLKDLYYGKYNLRDLEKIKLSPHLIAPKILPGFVS
jgi:alpha-L-glutamate ligase-like protein/uncharacterized protein (TIGR02421 family)